MFLTRRRVRVALTTVALLLCGLLAGPPSTLARSGAGNLVFAPCGDDGAQCATATVPVDYGRPGGRKLELPVVRYPATDRANRLGVLFVDFGGPGDATAETLRNGAIALFSAFNARYDIVGVDPRGTGGTDAIDCMSNPEQVGPTSKPFPRPETVDPQNLLARDRAYINACLRLNPRILPYVTTGNVARDFDQVRQALGERRINYYGYSYGTFLGATYESLFPTHTGRFVLDGALDADQYLNDPIQTVREQTKAFEVALGRFFQACARDQATCGFGGEDPWAAFDDLVDSMNARPLPASGSDPRPVDGDDLLAGSLIALYAKQNWGLLAIALQLAAAGDGTGVRILVDAFYGRRDDGTYDPFGDRFFAISSLEARFPKPGLRFYLKLGADDYQLFDHYWFNSGYYDLAQALWPVKPRGAYYGPYGAPSSAPTTLVVGTRYDPATPYKGARRLVGELDNARLLTMVGDGHTAYPGNSACIDAAVEAYVNQGVVPAAGTTCRQQVPFTLPEAQAATGAGTLRRMERAARRLTPHVRPGTVTAR
jgi:pimeloyl-ACP methyl ester carboxylesterase